METATKAQVANKSTKANIAPAKPAKAKAAKVNPLKDARKAMLDSAKEVRQSLADCIRVLAIKGGAWLKLVGLTPKQFAALTPSDLRPHQLETERYKAVINDSGELSKEEIGWTPAKVANAVQRMKGVK